LRGSSIDESQRVGTCFGTIADCLLNGRTVPRGVVASLWGRN
jgi:hypothetical protein